ncbi:zinc transporter ZIP3-like [Eurosta solidaginis]|uniref:zinc transporter ZIP3-like n=1 Tax=Eurosta solidaginis TaxID=178769 RepID=UPI0035305BA6
MNLPNLANTGPSLRQNELFNLMDLHAIKSIYSKNIYRDGTDSAVASDSSELLIAKVTAMVVLFGASTFCGSIPFILNYYFQLSKKHVDASSATVVKCLCCFGGGVLLSTTFQHLLPEVREIIKKLKVVSLIPDFTENLAELLMCMGFFIMYLIEELLHSYIHRRARLNKRDARAGCNKNIHLAREISSVTREFENGKTDNIFMGERTMSKTKEGRDEFIVNPSLCGIDCVVHNVAYIPDQSGSISKQNLMIQNVESRKYHPYQSNQNLKLQQNYEKNYHQQHIHSHVTDLANDDSIAMSGIFIVAALSLHELFEGMAVGLERDASDVWFMLMAVSAHKLVLAFCVGVELIVERTRFTLSIIYILTFAIVSPIGIGIGILISKNNETDTSTSIVSPLLQGFACGTLLYVVFFEILYKNRSGLSTYFSSLVGFLIMFALLQLDK